ncbi:glycosyltransferase family A protein [Prosthecomicrobium pneumaticum]|uniref:Glycosyltransferase 2-like domain-containing protein n=1 Tax=Prosthecomicrobium pneumaticum TaxID=81895 RepID=A0A7W9FP82_9HYPH|nr:hypothetical protein [Prosthecomicrobium pneumaticum]
MLRALLQSFAECHTPPGVEPLFLIVENDHQARSRATIESLRPKLGGRQLVLVLETELGIPFGRNRAIDEALARGADLLAFVDDDEVVARDWLVHLVAEYRRSGADLIGGPVRIMPPDAGLGPMQRAIHRGVAARLARREAQMAAMARSGRPFRHTIVTNNWLARTTLFSDHGLRFDESLRHTGGSDAAFDEQVRARGLSKSWAPEALVFETLPAERLSFAYQFTRAKDQSKVSLRRKMARGEERVAFDVLVVVPLRLVGSLGLVLMLPFRPGLALVDLARSLGWTAGRVLGLCGSRSRLYERITGD